MGYQTKIQKVSRPTNNSFYVNLPTAIAESIEIEKGEVFEWILEDKNTLILKRMTPKPLHKRKLDTTENPT